MSMFVSPHRRGHKKRRPLRYTKAAATEGSSRFKSVTDNSPGKSFKDPTGKWHKVPLVGRKNKRAQGKK